MTPAGPYIPAGLRTFSTRRVDASSTNRRPPPPPLEADPYRSSSLFFLIPESGAEVVYVSLELAALLLTLGLLVYLSVLRHAVFALSPADRLIATRAEADTGARLQHLLEQEPEVRLTVVTIGTFLRVLIVLLSTELVLRLVAPLTPGWMELFVPLVLGLGLLLFLAGELIPAWLVSGRTLAWSLRGARLLYGLHYVFRPVASRITRRWPAIQESHSVSPPDDPLANPELREEIDALEEEQELINSIVEYGRTTVREIMVSRMDIVAIPHTATLREALGVIRESGHSRLPLYEEHLDTILGLVYVKDLISIIEQARLDDVPNWRLHCRPPLLIPADLHIDDLLSSFQTKQTHIAIVVDEYGGTEGLVSLEDIIEEIVGDIRDEYDVHEKPLYEPVDTRTYRFDARIGLDEVDKVLAPLISVDHLEEILDDGYDFETLAGLIFFLTERIPEAGEQVALERLTLTVEELENHRIKSVLVHVAVEPHPADVEEFDEASAHESRLPDEEG